MVAKVIIWFLFPVLVSRVYICENFGRCNDNEKSRLIVQFLYMMLKRIIYEFSTSVINTNLKFGQNN